MWVNVFPNSTVPSDYDPFKQQFTLVDASGQPFNATMEYVDWLRGYGCRLGIIYGSQIGATLMMLAVFLLLTRREKRSSLIFVLNALCLTTNFILLILQSLYLTGNFFNVYSQLSGDTSRDTWQDTANTIAANTLALVLYIFIVLSLSLQVWVVCKTASTLQKVLIMGITTVFALIATGYRFAVTALSNMIYMKSTASTMRGYQTILDQMVIFQAVAIWLYCAVFTAKLGYALVQRKKLGMSQFGPMQIVFIMGAQTMVIPAIFSCLQFYKGVPEFASITFTLVCIFLPLSAIWAGIITDDRQIASHGPGAHQRILGAYFGRSGDTPNATTTKNSGGSGGTMGTMASTVGSCHKEGGGYSPGSSASANGGRNNGGGRNEYEDEDDEDLEDGIHVDHEWSVENGEKGNNSPRTSRYEATEANRYDPRGSKFVANAQHSV